MDKKSTVSALPLVSAFLYGMAAACGLITVINHQTVNIASPELILMGVFTLASFVWDFIRWFYRDHHSQAASE